MEAKAREKNTRKIPQFRTIREALYKAKVPRIKLEFAYEVKATGDILILEDLESCPSAKFPPSKFTKLYEAARVEVKTFKTTKCTTKHVTILSLATTYIKEIY